MENQTQRIAVLGGGSWGGTLSLLFSRAGHDVTIWTRNPQKADLINVGHRIDRPVRVELPNSVRASTDIAEATRQATIIMVCCPSQTVREVCTTLKSVIPPREGELPVIVSTVKGLELTTLKRISEVISEVLPGYHVASLSGPNLAAEIANGLPAAAVIASESIYIAQWLQAKLTVPTLRLYHNDDLIGVELGGTLKNVIAIAAGVSDGLKLGANAKSALLTRGLAEISRLATKLGAKPLTMAGLAGMGDLLATTSGPASRNYRLGMALAKGRRTEEILADMEVAVEGVPTAEAVCELSKKLGLEMPIAEQVEATLKGKSTPDRAIMTLMKRPLSSE